MLPGAKYFAFTAFLSIAINPCAVTAQSAGRQRITYSGLMSEAASGSTSEVVALASTTKYLRCGWLFWWDPPDMFGDFDIALAANGRNYTASGSGIGGSAELEIALDATYLPSMGFSCSSAGVVLGYGWTYYFDWLTHNLQWNNSTCDGHAGLQDGRPAQTRVSYTFGSTVQGSDWANMRNGWNAGATYWPSVGNSPSVYQQMSTPSGSDRTITWDSSLPSNVPALHHYPTRTFRVNPQYKTKPVSFWTVVGAHELGHALNSAHCLAARGESLS